MIRQYRVRKNGRGEDPYRLQDWVEAACDSCGAACPGSRIHGPASYGDGGTSARVTAQYTPGWVSGVAEATLCLWCPDCVKAAREQEAAAAK